MPRNGNTTARGYGAQHQRTRRQWKTVVDRGDATCVRCGRPILPGTPWDLDHTDDRTAYLGPSHRHENRAAGARKTNTQRRRRTRLTW